jgi:hypothetical protein
MAAIALSAIRQRVVAAVVAGLGASGWREAPEPFDLFGTRASDQRLDQGFAVGLTRTQDQGGRQRLTEGAVVLSRVAIRWSVKSKAKAQVVSYDAALDAEETLIRSVMAQHRSADLHIIYQESSRVVVDEGWILGTIEFETRHRLALS